MFFLTLAKLRCKQRTARSLGYLKAEHVNSGRRPASEALCARAVDRAVGVQHAAPCAQAAALSLQCVAGERERACGVFVNGVTRRHATV